MLTEAELAVLYELDQRPWQTVKRLKVNLEEELDSATLANLDPLLRSMERKGLVHGLPDDLIPGADLQWTISSKGTKELNS
ncbi:hypothetical protein LCGC14_0864760 [marine sediment metagenome]|uniref:HTH marR-type domain-containing protein n=1 Tax=marine sediment metagenome TaxID=412755 RepID=A0A0F9PBD0_9ZZZZ